ncbi:MAG: glycine zipper 2TM domain-containing protein [Planctomycetes bacterium]|nr:glycine zipper 2TM domain-containing protein [Planctomycetota bacterium]
MLGTAIGVGVGQAIGRDTEGTLIGAAIGAGAGYIIGNESDKKKARTEPEPKPEIVQSPAKTQADNDTTVNIQNDNGSVSPVKLKKQGVGYVGPKGEYYDHLPAEEELRQAGYGL